MNKEGRVNKEWISLDRLGKDTASLITITLSIFFMFCFCLFHESNQRINIIILKLLKNLIRQTV